MRVYICISESEFVYYKVSAAMKIDVHDGVVNIDRVCCSTVALFIFHVMRSVLPYFYRTGCCFLIIDKTRIYCQIIEDVIFWFIKVLYIV